MQLIGYLQKIYSKDSLGYSSFLLITENGQAVDCRGVLIYIDKYLPLILEGDYNGDSFVANQIVVNYTSKPMSFFLGKSKIAGLGISTINKLLYECGNTLNNLSDKDCEFIANLRLPETSATKIISLFKRLSIQQCFFDFCRHYEIPFNKYERMIKENGANIMDLLKNNPFSLGVKYDLDVISCENIAKDFAVEKLEAPERFDLLALTIANKILSYGGSYLPESEFDELLNKKTLNIDSELSFPYIKAMVLSFPSLKKVEVNKQIRIYNSNHYYLEKEVALKLEKFKHPNNIINTNVINDGVMDADQSNTVNNVLHDDNISIITGGPGVGKTTVIKRLLSEYENAGKKVMLCAPTGRAASRLMESTGYPAQTIHKAIGCTSYSLYTNVDVNDLFSYQVFIIDEMSMTGLELFNEFISYLPFNSKLILVGDEDQLPSVESGAVFRDMIKSNKYNVNRLTIIHRQNEYNSIVINSKKIKQKQTDLVVDDNFSIIQLSSAKDIINKATKLFMKEYDSDNIFSCQLLSPIKYHELGKENLCCVMQNTLQPANLPAVYYNKHKYKVNDKIMAVMNNYSLGYRNGDMGKVSEIQDGCIKALFGDKGIWVDLDEIELAYASTVHKLQGSEVDCVIIILSDEYPGMLFNNLIYTAITRAKKKVYIICQNDALVTAIKTNGKQRYTSLLE